MTPLAEKALEVAAAEIGVREDPPGSNTSPRIRVYQDYIGRWAEGQSWCVCFALWAIAHAAHLLGAESRLPKVASTAQLYRWLEHNGKLLARPVPGCLALVRGGPTGHEHTCLVESVAGESVRTLDGNWGNSVTRATHPVAGCDFGAIV